MLCPQGVALQKSSVSGVVAVATCAQSGIYLPSQYGLVGSTEQQRKREHKEKRKHTTTSAKTTWLDA